MVSRRCIAEILPPNDSDGSGKDDRRGRSEGGNFLSIGHLHLHGNDLAELRKLAEVSPHLAERVIDQRDAEDVRANVSYRFGMVASVVLVGLTLACITTLMIFVGVASTVAVIGLILAVALLVRVVLTGQWSDTSWFGKLVGMLAKALGSTGNDDPAK